MLSWLKYGAIVVVISAAGYAGYDYVGTKRENAVLEAHNKQLEEANKSIETVLTKVDALAKKVDNSLLKVEEQSKKLDGVARDLRRASAEARKTDETYKQFTATPVHPFSIGLFRKARTNGDAVQDEVVDKRSGDSAARHAAPSGSEGRR